MPKSSAPGAGRPRPSPSTRSIQKQTPTRTGAKRPSASNPTVLLAVAGGGVVLLAIGAYVLMSGGAEKPEHSPPKAASKAAPVDVSGLEREGMSKCDEGLALIKKNESLLMNHSLSDSQKSALKADLERGRKLIGDGMGLLTQANEKSGNRYELAQYQEALITVRKKLMELRD